MSDWKDKAFTFAQDTIKQLMTLATAVLTLTLTFHKEFLPAGSTVAKGWLVAAWIAELLSIVAGVWALLAMTGSLGDATDQAPADVWGSNVAIPAGIAILLFAGGLALTIIYAAQALA
jgi:hypothetical protein